MHVKHKLHKSIFHKNRSLSAGLSVKKQTVCTVFFCLVFSLLLHMAAAAAHRQLLQQGIAEEVLRFHVLANSDSKTDQDIKYLVRDKILSWLEQETSQEQTREDMEQFLASHLQEITAVSDRVLASQGVLYRSSVRMEKCYFPERTYGSCTFPAGCYESLRICLGNASGQNWWCVLFPKLCFADCLHAVVEEEQQKELQELLTAEEYESLLRHPDRWKISFRWF